MDTLTYDASCEKFAECWADGLIELCMPYARMAERHWKEQWEKEVKTRAATWGFEWPLPGVPEADEATGWTQWYGGAISP